MMNSNTVADASAPTPLLQSSQYQGPISQELYYLIERFLSLGPCQETAQVVPTRKDWEGVERGQTYSNYVKRLEGKLPKDYLYKLCEQLASLQGTNGAPNTCALRPSLLSCGKHNLLRNLNNNQICGREYGARLRKQSVISPTCLSRNMEHRYRILGHLSSTFCLSFDTIGDHVFTGADDNLVKVWNVRDGKLRFTFRGSMGEISDMAINQENSLIAAGSVDKIVRVWCLRTGNLVGVLAGHSAMTTSVGFLPSGDTTRYLVSTSNDCNVCFWKYTTDSNQFETLPIKFSERLKPGSQMVCSTHSPGGRYVVTGCSDSYIRIYLIESGQEPVKIDEIEAHTDRVDSLQWAHSGVRFMSGSKDGVAKIWTYKEGRWVNISLIVGNAGNNQGGGSQSMPSASNHSTAMSSSSKTQKIKVTMVAWNLDDTLAITAASDFILRLWDSNTGQQLSCLSGHKDESFVLESHPIHPGILMSAGHDGHLILWDLKTRKQLFNHHNIIEGAGHGAFFDAKFSPDGTMIAGVDSHGHLSYFSISSNSALNFIPNQQFFHTDFRPLIRDQNGFVIDEQTGTAPHLMAPPILVNAEGAPYPADVQRLVPGKESSSLAYLQSTVVRRQDADGVVDVEDTGETSGPDGQNGTGLGLRNEDDQNGERDGSGSSEEDEFNWYDREAKRAKARSDEMGMEDEGAASSGGGRLSSRRRGGHLSSHEYSTRGNNRQLPGRLRDEDHAHDLSSEANRRTSSTTAEAHHRNPSRTRPPRDLTPEQAPQEEDEAPDRPDDRSYSSRSSSRSAGSSTSTSDSEAEGTSDSDYAEDQPSTSTTTKQPRKRRTRSQESGDEQEEGDWTTVGGGDEGEDEDNKEVDLFDDKTEDPEQPSTSTKSSTKPKTQEKKKRGRRNLESLEFPPWVTAKTVRKTPYFPQIGDEVVYIVQGYHLYLEAVEQFNIYRIPKKFYPKSRLRGEVAGKIVSLEYVMDPYRLCCITLLREDTGESIQIKYHDVPNVIDFFVLKQHYDKSLRRKWKKGDRFEAVIDDKWWFGHISKMLGTNSVQHPEHFQSIEVLWDNGEDETMSPWDLEDLRPTTVTSPSPTKRSDSMEAKEEELVQLGAYEEREGDWPSPLGRETTLARVSRGLQIMRNEKVAEAFHEPVDLSVYPSYLSKIAYPVDLHTVHDRLNNGFYRRQRALEFDVRQLCENATSFNEPHAQIVKTAKCLRETLLRVIKPSRPRTERSLPPPDPDPDPEDDPLLSSQTKRSRLVLAAGATDPGKRPHVVQLKHQKPAWIDQSDRLLTKMITSDNNRPFEDPENMDNIFDSGEPQTLTEIREKLRKGGFDGPHGLQDAVHSLLTTFKNSAPEKRSSAYKCTIGLRSIFDGEMDEITVEFEAKRDEKVHRRESRERKRNSIESSNNGSSKYDTRSTRRPRPLLRPQLSYSNRFGDDDDGPCTSIDLTSSTSPGGGGRSLRRTRSTRHSSQHTVGGGTGSSTRDHQTSFNKNNNNNTSAISSSSSNSQSSSARSTRSQRRRMVSTSADEDEDEEDGEGSRDGRESVGGGGTQQPRGAATNGHSSTNQKHSQQQHRPLTRTTSAGSSSVHSNASSSYSYSNKPSTSSTVVNGTSSSKVQNGRHVTKKKVGFKEEEESEDANCSGRLVKGKAEEEYHDDGDEVEEEDEEEEEEEEWDVKEESEEEESDDDDEYGKGRKRKSSATNIGANGTRRSSRRSAGAVMVKKEDDDYKDEDEDDEEVTDEEEEDADERDVRNRANDDEEDSDGEEEDSEESNRTPSPPTKHSRRNPPSKPKPRRKARASVSDEENENEEEEIVEDERVSRRSSKHSSFRRHNGGGGQGSSRSGANKRGRSSESRGEQSSKNSRVKNGGGRHRRATAAVHSYYENSDEEDYEDDVPPYTFSESSRGRMRKVRRLH